MKREWWRGFFDGEYRVFHKDRPFQDTERELQLFQRILGNGEGRWLLDACCGPGRHLPGWRDLGWSTVGVDFSAPLLGEAGEYRRQTLVSDGPSVELVQADLTHPFSVARFAAAVCLFTSIGYCEEPWYDRAILQSIGMALQPDGRLILDVANRDFLVRHPDATRNWWEHDGDLVLEETTFNPVTSRATTRMSRVGQDGGRVESSYQIRLYSLHEILGISVSAGFDVEDGYGDYGGGGLGLGSPRIILVLRKAKHEPV